MPDIDKIREHLTDTARYHGMSYAAIVGVAAEIEAVEDKDARAALRREFRELHGLTAQVWARIPKRFGTDGSNYTAQEIRAMAYCCQLGRDACHELYFSHADHIREPGALGLVLRDVNDALDARRNGHGAKRATIADEVAHFVMGYDDDELDPMETIECIRSLPAVAAVLAKRAKAEGK